MIHYPVAIEPGTETTTWGVIVPDLPGCFSAGDTLDEALDAARDAAAAWIDSTLDAGHPIPGPSPLEALGTNPEFAGYTLAIVSIDPAILDDRAERVNITLPRRVLHRLDALAKAAGETRSGFIARQTLMHER